MSTDYDYRNVTSDYRLTEATGGVLVEAMSFAAKTFTVRNFDVGLADPVFTEEGVAHAIGMIDRAGLTIEDTRTSIPDA